MYRHIARTKVIALLIAAGFLGLMVLPSFTSSAKVAKRLSMVSKSAPQDPVSPDGLGPNIVSTNIYRQTNLVSDIPNLGQIIDPNLVNPWGISMSATSPFWVANNVTSTATLYGGDVGSAPAFKNPLVVTIPGNLPTGTVFNGGTDFVITAGGGTGPARFIFASITGNITAWRAGTAAIITSSQPGHVYTGLAIGNNGSGNFLYAADFAHAKIDVFNSTFASTTLAGNFTDPALPAGFAPFNIQSLGGKLYVMYAKVDPMTGEEEAGPGLGFVSTFDFNGNFLQRLISNGALNAPWGIALAPSGFGMFGSDLLIGNFGDGKISAFNPTSGAFHGTMNDQSGHELEIEGLWAIAFGNGVGGGDTNNLYFNAGIGDEEHGIFGRIQAAATPGISFEFSAAEFAADESQGFATVTVNRLGDTVQTATVNFATISESSAGHASPANDFISTGGTLRFASGEVSKTFRVLIIDDIRVEGDEHVDVMLSNPTGAALGARTRAEVKIVDNDSASSTGPLPKTFVASFDGAHEVPPRASNGNGTGVVIVTDEATGAAKVSLNFSGLTSRANAAHIHGPAAEGVNAPILFPITIPFETSGSANDVGITMTPTQVQQLKDGLFYFNVHSDNFPGGEIRGQIKFNPIDEPGYFAREQYLDFLNRNPDANGLSFWTNQITACGANTICISNRRIDVSAQFFLAQEFQTRSLFVYLVRKAAYGALPRLSQFSFDRSLIGTGSDADRKTFTEGFVQNGEFLGVYPASLNGSDYIDKLIATVLAGSGVDLNSRRPDLTNEYVMEATQAASRARVLRRLVGYPEYMNAEFNRGFVAAEYYGYLRRTPDTSGFNFWLGVLNANSNNYRSMVCAFITSDEYQKRFGPASTRGNTECSTVAP
ncbi:MAG TPA: TIGR03118 family protein [Pyrinomonadaceae bacterium]|nr:TIGR03118 family protein [Pyrinomonadaceae bacterium]